MHATSVGRMHNVTRIRQLTILSGLITALSIPECGACAYQISFAVFVSRPYIAADDFRSCCDLYNLFFVLDEHTDTAPLSTVQAICNASKDAVEHPDKPRPDGEHIVGEMSRQFVSREVSLFMHF